MQSKYLTILGCSIFFKRLISVLIEPFLSSLMMSRETYFIATREPFYRLRALYTLPHDPWPITSPI